MMPSPRNLSSSKRDSAHLCTRRRQIVKYKTRKYIKYKTEIHFSKPTTATKLSHNFNTIFVYKPSRYKALKTQTHSTELIL